MKYIQKEYQQILDIYSSSIPNFIIPFLQAPVLQRITGIGQNCGTEFSCLYDYKTIFSRFEHSLGVSMIIWNFTKDKKQTLSWLFHDISHSVFSHVGDFILWDAEKQEASEQYITQLLKKDTLIVRELEKLGLSLSDVDDYEKYPIADNPGPQLAADRLEYNLSSAITLGTLNIDEIQEIYTDIHVIKNEYWADELAFKNPRMAEKFWFLSINNDATNYSSPKSVISMSFISEIIKRMLTNNELSHMDLYKLQDSEIIQMMQESKDEQVRNMWKYYQQLSTLKLYNTEPVTDNYYINSRCKKRFVDPLIHLWTTPLRLSKYSNSFLHAKNKHLEKNKQWVSINYKLI